MVGTNDTNLFILFRTVPVLDMVLDRGTFPKFPSCEIVSDAPDDPSSFQSGSRCPSLASYDEEYEETEFLSASTVLWTLMCGTLAVCGRTWTERKKAFIG